MMSNDDTTRIMSITPDLVGVPDPEDGESHHMLTPEDVSRPAATGHTRNLTSEMKQKIKKSLKIKSKEGVVVSFKEILIEPFPPRHNEVFVSFD